MAVPLTSFLRKELINKPKWGLGVSIAFEQFDYFY
jgi:hypothetical protein